MTSCTSTFSNGFTNLAPQPILFKGVQQPLSCFPLRMSSLALDSQIMVSNIYNLVIFLLLDTYPFHLSFQDFVYSLTIAHTPGKYIAFSQGFLFCSSTYKNWTHGFVYNSLMPFPLQTYSLSICSRTSTKEWGRLASLICRIYMTKRIYTDIGTFPACKIYVCSTFPLPNRSEWVKFDKSPLNRPSNPRKSTTCRTFLKKLQNFLSHVLASLSFKLH